MDTRNVLLKAWAVASGIGRAVFAVSLICVTALLAWLLAKGLVNLLTELGYFEADAGDLKLMGTSILFGASAVSIGAILSFARSILGSVVNLWDYVVVPKKLDMRREALTSFFTFLAIAIPIAITDRLIEPMPVPPACEPDEACLSRRPDSSQLPVFAFTFEPASVSSADSWRNVDDPFEKSGIELDEAQRDRLTELIKALKPCAGPGSDEQVRLDVIGFASSKNFRGFSEADSNELNLRAANARAEYVAGKLRQARADEGIKEEELEISTDPHVSFDEMAAKRSFNDRPPGSTEENPAQLFTRAAWVKLLSVGSCARAECRLEVAR